MKAGRKKIPVSLKIIAGTLQESRENPNAPKVTPAKPRRPTWVSKDGRKYWPAVMRDLELLHVVTPAHGTIAALYCDTLALYLKQREMLETENIRYVTRKGQGEAKAGDVIVRSHPILGAMNETKRLLVSMLSEFGLTPAATSRVSVFPGFPVEPPKGMDGKPTKDATKTTEQRFFGS